MQKCDGSDYITMKKSRLIYSNVKYNAVHSQTANPVKLNGKTYNNQLALLLPQVCNTVTCTGGVITAAQSYDLLQTYATGKKYYVCTCLGSCTGCKPCAID